MTAPMTPDQPQHQIPLAMPLYNASIGQAVIRFWRKYFHFSGRASRSEYWWWTLVTVAVSYLLSGINWAIVGFPQVPAEPQTNLGSVMAEAFYHSLLASIIPGIWGLLTCIGSLAVMVRRLHDTNRRGWWYFLNFVPFVGSVIVIVFLALPPEPAGARFDRHPAN